MQIKPTFDSVGAVCRITEVVRSFTAQTMKEPKGSQHHRHCSEHPLTPLSLDKVFIILHNYSYLLLSVSPVNAHLGIKSFHHTICCCSNWLLVPETFHLSWIWTRTTQPSNPSGQCNLIPTTVEA